MIRWAICLRSEPSRRESGPARQWRFAFRKGPDASWDPWGPVASENALGVGFRINLLKKACRSSRVRRNLELSWDETTSDSIQSLAKNRRAPFSKTVRVAQGPRRILEPLEAHAHEESDRRVALRLFRSLLPSQTRCSARPAAATILLPSEVRFKVICVVWLRGPPFVAWQTGARPLTPPQTLRVAGFAPFACFPCSPP